jgi:hypothetical protein
LRERQAKFRLVLGGLYFPAHLVLIISLKCRHIQCSIR